MLTVVSILGAWCVVSVVVTIVTIPAANALNALPGALGRAFHRYCDSAPGYLSLAIPWLVLIAPCAVAFAVGDRVWALAKRSSST